MRDLELSAIGLVVDDRDPQAVFDAMLAKYVELAPDAVVRNGSVEARLLAAFAEGAGDVIYALNRVITLVVEGVLSRYGIERFVGSPAVGMVTCTLDAARSLTITAGQRFADPTSGLVLEVAADAEVTTATSITVAVATAEPGAAGNALAAGTALDLLDSIPYVVSAELLTGLTGGADPETDATYFDRVSTVLARVTSSIVKPEHFLAATLQDPRVGRATVLDLYAPGGTPGSDLGDVTVFVYGHGAGLSGPVQAEIEANLQAMCAAMIHPHVVDVTIRTQAIALTVHALPGYSTPTIQAGVEAALRAFYNPASYPFGRDVLESEITAIAADVAGVDYVTPGSVTPAGSVAVDVDELVLAGAITVTVTT